MAPRRRRLLRSNSSVLVSVAVHKVGHLVFRFDVKRLFADDDSRRRRREVLPLPPSHVACFRRPLCPLMDLAASPDGDKIVAATMDGHIMVYDATRSQYTYDHQLRCRKLCPILLALSSRPRPSSGAAAVERSQRRGRDDDMSMLVATGGPDLSKPDEASFEAVRLTSGGRLQSLPIPPPLLSPPLPDNWRCYGYRARVTSYFVASGRVWLSVGEGAGKGTYSYSLDMAAPNGWRREGSWVLPLDGRAVYAPDLGLLLGFHRERPALCAMDMEARPPVIRQLWTLGTVIPSKDEGFSAEEDYLCLRLVGLAYLGGGRLCISWSSPHRNQGERMLLALTAVELKRSTPNGEGELLLRKRRSRCYRLPPGNQKATVLPSL